MTSLIRALGDATRNRLRSGLYGALSRDLITATRVVEVNPGPGPKLLCEVCGVRPSIFSSVASISGLADLPQPVARDERAVFVSSFGLEPEEDLVWAISSLAKEIGPNSSLVVAHYSRLFGPLIRVLEFLGLKPRQEYVNLLSPAFLKNLLTAAGLEVVHERNALLLPLMGRNGILQALDFVLSKVPVVRFFCAARILVARPSIKTATSNELNGLTVLVPARNEAGNVVSLAERIPDVDFPLEVIFIEGGSTDDTWQRIESVLNDSRFSRLGCKAVKQTGLGKGQAVRQGIDLASQPIVMILDSDLSVRPEEISNFVRPLHQGLAEFANGTRLILGMERKAMRPLNLLGNLVFSKTVGLLAGIAITDSLCGSKVFYRSDYIEFAKLGLEITTSDPFGDFELLFMASLLHRRIVEVPVRYQARSYGETNISRFRDGYRLFKVLLSLMRAPRKRALNASTRL